MINRFQNTECTQRSAIEHLVRASHELNAALYNLCKGNLIAKNAEELKSCGSSDDNIDSLRQVIERVRVLALDVSGDENNAVCR